MFSVHSSKVLLENEGNLASMRNVADCTLPLFARLQVGDAPMPPRYIVVEQLCKTDYNNIDSYSLFLQLAVT